ncbi:MAG: light-harvesting protein [Pseudomonadota bacterium]
MAAEKASLSGLTAQEAQEFHKLFVKGAIAMSLLPFLAHISAWFWRPWL